MERSTRMSVQQRANKTAHGAGAESNDGGLDEGNNF